MRGLREEGTMGTARQVEVVRKGNKRKRNCLFRGGRGVGKRLSDRDSWWGGGRRRKRGRKQVQRKLQEEHWGEGTWGRGKRIGKKNHTKKNIMTLKQGVFSGIKPKGDPEREVTIIFDNILFLNSSRNCRRQNKAQQGIPKGRDISTGCGGKRGIRSFLG